MTEQIERFEDLSRTAAESREPRAGDLFLKAARRIFRRLDECSPLIAGEWLAMLEPLRWNNYLSEKEAADALARIVSRDGHTGPVWSQAQVAEIVRDLGGDLELPPCYNAYALGAAMNLVAAGHAQTIARHVPEDQLPGVAYGVAVEILTDPGRPSYIRERLCVGEP